jgi:hypothetical protein
MPSPRLTGVLVAAAAAMFMVQLDFFALNFALPQMSKDLGITVTPTCSGRSAATCSPSPRSWSRAGGRGTSSAAAAR